MGAIGKWTSECIGYLLTKFEANNITKRIVIPQAESCKLRQ